MSIRPRMPGAATLLIAVLAAALFPLPAASQDAPHYVMRHLNTPAGERDPDLTRDGKANAERLVRWFEGKPLSAILVSDYRRTRQTVAPLAARRGISVETYAPGNTPALVARVSAIEGAVLVVGHSNTVPDIVEGLGGERPDVLGHDDFGDVWTIVGGRTARVRLAR